MWFTYRQNLSYSLKNLTNNQIDELFFTDNKIILSTINEYKIHTNLKKDFLIYKKYEHELKETFEDFLLFKAMFLKRYFFSFYIIPEREKQVIKSRDLYSTNMRFLNLYSYFYYFKRVFYFFSGFININIFELDFFFYNLMSLKGISKKINQFFGFTFKLFSNLSKKKLKQVNRFGLKKIIKLMFLKKKKIRTLKYMFLPTIQQPQFRKKFYIKLRRIYKRFFKKYNKILFLVKKNVLTEKEKKINNKLFTYINILYSYYFSLIFDSNTIRSTKVYLNLQKQLKKIIYIILKSKIKGKRYKFLKKVLDRLKKKKLTFYKFLRIFLFNLSSQFAKNIFSTKIDKKLVQNVIIKKLKTVNNKLLNVQSKFSFNVKKDMRKNRKLLYRKSKLKLRSEKVSKKDNFVLKLNFLVKIYCYSKVIK